VPVDAHAPHVASNSASEWFDASYVFTALPEGLPSNWRHQRYTRRVGMQKDIQTSVAYRPEPNKALAAYTSGFGKT
jgi:hypothetical protein